MPKVSSAWQRVEDLASVLGQRFTVGVISVLMAEPQTYGSIRKTVPGIGDATLTARLHQLEDLGIVKRTVLIDKRKPVINYEVTKRGSQLKPIIVSLNEWALGRVAKAE